MRGADKWLFGITAFSLLLVATSLVIVLNREKPQYWPEGTPLATAHNYILAFKQNDLARAYSYLSPTLKGYPPSLGEFIKHINKFRRGEHLSFALTLELNDSGEHKTIEVRVWERRFLGNSLELIFGLQNGTRKGTYLDRDRDGHFIRSFDMQLQLENSDWKIVDSQTYWRSCWEAPNGCE